VLADELDAGQIEPDAVLREVVRLRLRFEAQRRFEELVLHPMLREAGLFRAIPVASVSWRKPLPQLALASDVTVELRLTLDALRTGLDAEDRPYRSLRVLQYTTELGGPR